MVAGLQSFWIVLQIQRNLINKQTLQSCKIFNSLSSDYLRSRTASTSGPLVDFFGTSQNAFGFSWSPY